MEHRYIRKYLVCRGLPVTAVTFALAGSLMYMARSLEDRRESTALLILSLLILIGTYGFFLVHVIRFSCMIRRQQAQYGVPFQDDNSVTISKFPYWVILSKAWLILPGRLALLRAHICHASVTSISEKGANYQVKLKCKDGSAYTIRFYSEDSAKKIRNWCK